MERKMSTNTKRVNHQKKHWKNCALSLMKRRHRKKEEFAALDVDYRKILEFVEAGTLVRIKTVIIPTGSTAFQRKN